MSIWLMAELRTTFRQTVRALASVAEKRDPYTAGHQQRVAKLACAIGGKLSLGPGDMMRPTILRPVAMQSRRTQFSAQSRVRNTSQHLRPTAFSARMPMISAALLLKKMMFQSRSTVKMPSATESMMNEHSEVQGNGLPSG